MRASPLQPTSYKLPPTQGQTALSMVFVIGGIIVLFGTTLAFLALSFLNSTFGFQAANRAEAMAEGGLADAMLQLERNQAFASGGYCVPYSAGGTPCPSGSAQVTVTQSSPTAGQVTALADATVTRYRRKFQAVFSVNASTTQVELISLTPVTQ